MLSPPEASLPPLDSSRDRWASGGDESARVVDIRFPHLQARTPTTNNQGRATSVPFAHATPLSFTLLYRCDRYYRPYRKWPLSRRDFTDLVIRTRSLVICSMAGLREAVSHNFFGSTLGLFFKRYQRFHGDYRCYSFYGATDRVT